MGVYTCRMRQTITLDIKANSYDEALDWISTHDFQDVINATTKFDNEWEDEIMEILPDDAEYAIDIS